MGVRSVEAALEYLASVLGDKQSPGAPLQHVFVQFRMDNLGCHEYVCLGEVDRLAKAKQLDSRLAVVLEDAVKALRQQLGDAVVVLTATPPERRITATTLSQTSEDHDLCPPHGLFRNYNVVEELTLGRTQRVMLSDENTLRGPVEKNGIKIFNHLSLIVNAHESVEAHRPGKYGVGSAQPKILFQPIHKLMRARTEEVISVMDGIQEEMWRSLQEGSVAVHCLAGVHRAPTVVVCHFLYRHYALGHRHISNDVAAIYRSLKAIRPGVEPLGYIILIAVPHVS